MSSVNAIVGAVSRAIDRLGKKAEFRSDSAKAFEERLLEDAMEMAGPGFTPCLRSSINDIWNKPRRITVDEKKRRQGQLREILSLVTPHDAPLEKAIESERWP